jgi:hypothetical protein
VTELGLCTEQCSLAEALSLGARALRFSETAGEPALASAAVSADALVLGKLQRQDTLQARSPARFDVALVHRSTTGTEAQISGALLYHALALPRVDALFADASPRTLLNRNLRPLLRGYAAAGVPLRYFGTEVLALLGQPVALVGYDQTSHGAVLIEVLVGLEAPCVVRPALKREPPAALYSALRSEPPPFELLERAVRGLVERLGVQSFDLAPSLPPAAAVVRPAARTAPVSVDVPLGVVEATAPPELELGGDLLVSSAALAEVEARARAALGAGQPCSEALVEPLLRAPLDGARPADVLRALALASGV